MLLEGLPRPGLSRTLRQLQPQSRAKGAEASEDPMAELAEEAPAGVDVTTEAGKSHEAANGDKMEAPATDIGDSLPPPVAAAPARAAEAGAEL